MLFRSLGTVLAAKGDLAGAVEAYRRAVGVNVGPYDIPLWLLNGLEPSQRDRETLTPADGKRFERYLRRSQMKEQNQSKKS